MGETPGFRQSIGPLFFLMIAVLLMASESRALSPDKKLHQYVRRTWTTKEGLPNNITSSVCRTDDGYLWIGTQEGLVRFDGHSFRVYSSADHEVFGSNWIWKLKKDPKGRLWIATYNAGVVRYENGGFAAFRVKDGLTEENIRDFAFDADGSTWVGTKGQGVFHFDAGDKITHVSQARGLCGDQVMSMAVDEENNLWVATLDRGICVRKNGQFRSVSTNSPEGLARALSLARGSGNTIWIGSLFGLFQVNDNVATQFKHPKLPQDGVRAIYHDAHGNLWIGFVKKGLCVLRPSGDLECDEEGEGGGYEGVLDFFELDPTTLFVACGAALQSFGDGDVKTYTAKDGLPMAALRGLLADSTGAIWFGTAKGVKKMRDGVFVDFPQEQALSSLSIVALYQDAQGRVWFGTEQQGIYFIETDESLVKLEASLFKEHFDAYSIVQLGDKMVFGTLGMGLQVYDGAGIDSYRTSEGLPNDVVWRMFPFDEQSIVVGTNKGVALFDGEKVIPLPGAEDTREDMVLAFEAEDDGTLYMGTHGKGLLAYKDRVLHRVEKKHGLPTQSILGLAVGTDGNLWLGTDQGIVKAPRQQLRGVLDDPSRTVEARSYSLQDGMLSDDCTGGQQYGLQISKAGEVFAATSLGASVIDPSRLKPDDAAPIMLIEKFLIDGKDVPLSGPIVLEHTAKSFEIHYTGINFHDADGVRFRYRLHGYDSDWQEVGGRRAAYYTNLGPGEYRFEVSGANRYGPWSLKASALAFNKKPHFTETRTFYVLCALALFLLIVLVVKLRLRALTERARVLDQKVKERTRDLEQAHEKIVALEKEALERQMAGGFAHEIRNALVGSKMLLAKLLAPDGSKQGSMSVSEKISQILVELLTKLKSMIAKPELAQVAPLLKNVNDEQKKIDEYLRKTYGSIERCMKVTDAIVEYSQAGQRGKGDDAIQIDDFLRSLKDTFDVDFGDTGIALELDSESRATWKGSTSHLHSIVWSLVLNAKQALEVRRRDGIAPKIGLQSYKGDEGVTITVSDNGPGIPAELLERIFEPFVSTKPATGVGLGLSLCRKLAGLYGGELRGENKKGEESGAVFTLVLPLESTIVHSK